MSESEEKLKKAVTDVLKENKSYHSLRAQMRTLVYNILIKNNEDEKLKKQPDQRLELANEIVREYLEWSGCFYTKDTFEQESGLEPNLVPRKHLLDRMGFTDSPDSAKLPVLLGILETLKEDNFTNN